MKKLRTFILLLLFTLVVLNACSGGDDPTPAPTSTPVAAEAPEVSETPEEEPTEGPESPLAAPESPLAVPESPLDTPANRAQPVTTATTGAVIGVVTVQSRPVADMIVALAPVIQPEAGPPRATGYDPVNSPQTRSDSTGYFAVNEVEPGLYGVILDGIRSAVMLSDPETKESIIVEIKAGEVVDIGSLDYESLDLPGFN
jgi:hypothetical protein